MPVYTQKPKQNSMISNYKHQSSKLAKRMLPNIKGKLKQEVNEESPQKDKKPKCLISTAPKLACEKQPGTNCPKKDKMSNSILDDPLLALSLSISRYEFSLGF